MSASSRVFASNNISNRLYMKNLYNATKVQEDITRCSVCSDISENIRMNTCSYNCYEKSVISKSRKPKKSKKPSKFLIWLKNCIK